MTISSIQLISLVLAGICAHICGGFAFFGYIFAADATPEDRLPMRLLILGMPCYFTSIFTLQAFGFNTCWHQAYIWSLLLSDLILMISIKKKKYFVGVCGQEIFFSFYVSVIVVASLSLYIAILI
ncbi:hypothetical protein NIES2100_17320 [Calothrix sp. NIES-2100]|uniref:hypothetical protein n=1 Tax=Calothrix sp. NIES-2100 TaxID=1954172 RepID=UPI000B5ED5AC|nr:hypothetical protein NIES2100_17320 [Calothrix sp. NIES-2100]